MVKIQSQFGLSPVAKDALSIRLAVFVDEQGFSRELEIDDLDNESWHLVAYDDHNQPLATARLHEDHPHIWHVQRVATHKIARGRGLGRALFAHIASLAPEHGITQLTLGAQQSAQGFYEKLGFSVQGEPFLEEGVPHIEMIKNL
jgi:predicted GNAT family N-acyltransferase